MKEEKHEIIIKFNTSEDLYKAYEELISKGYNISSVSDYKIVTLDNETITH